MRLIEIRDGESTSTFAYNGDGDRIVQTVDGGTMIRTPALHLIMTCLALSACQSWYRISCESRPPSFPTGDDATRVDRSLLTGEPCLPPCWQGITPGESTEEDVAAILEQASFVNTDSLEWLQDDEGTDVAVMWVSPAVSDWASPDASPYAMSHIIFGPDGTVSSISTDLEYELGVQDLIELAGEPDYYRSHFYGPNASCLMFELYWPQDGLMVVLGPLPEGVGLPHNTLVWHADYIAPTDDLTQYLLILGHSSEASRDLFLSSLREWEGLEAVNLSDHP